MTCPEFDRDLERAACGEALSAEAEAHAALCASCAFSLRLETTLREAPRWSLFEPRLSAETRANLLAKARLMTPLSSWFGGGPLLEQSAWNAAAILLALVLGYFGLPLLLHGTLPEPVYGTLVREITPPMKLLEGFLAPLLKQPWGLFALAAAGFALCFSASLGARLHSRMADA